MSVGNLYISIDAFETRVALRENARLVMYRVERHRTSSMVGNLYRGRVTRVLPGMQSAFVDIGARRDAFLHVREAGGAAEELAELFVEPGGEVADETPDFDLSPAEEPGADGRFPVRPEAEEARISDLLREGQELTVQVVKDGLGTKGARLTTYVSLPGRLLVYLPTVRHLGVSRRIVDPDERERLRSILETFPGGGWIVRTAGEGMQAQDLVADRDNLLRLWQRLSQIIETASAPSLVHRDLSPELRTVRDLFSDEIQECWVDDIDAYREILDFLDQFDPRLVSRVKLYRRTSDMMAAFGVDRELEKALRPKVWLKSGGYLVVNQTEALVAIDVNTGKFVGSRSLEDTVYRINLEAVREIVRQLRLRDLGGIVVVDFIDMEDPEHRAEVYRALTRELAADPARSQLLPMSDIGLVQLTRKRTRPSLDRTLSRECPYCHGSGRLKSLATICLDIRRRILDLAEREGLTEVQLVTHPDVAQHLHGSYREIVRELEDVHSIRVLVAEDPLFHHEQFEVVT